MKKKTLHIKFSCCLVVGLYQFACLSENPDSSATNTSCPLILTSGNAMDSCSNVLTANSSGTTTTGEEPNATTSYSTGSTTEISEDVNCGNKKLDEGEDCDPSMEEPEEKNSSEYKNYLLSNGNYCDPDTCKLNARIVFLSSKSVSFGGPDGLYGLQKAHEECNALAAKSEIQAVKYRKYMAWLGHNDNEDSKQDPCECFNPSVYNLEATEPVNFIRSDGKRIAPDWLTILGKKEDPNKEGAFLSLEQAIDVDEFGNHEKDAILAWSNIKNGLAVGITQTDSQSPSCQQWKWDSQNPLHGGRVGLIHQVNEHIWSYDSTLDLKSCDSDNVRLYCFEQCSPSEGSCFPSKNDYCFDQKDDVICP